MATRQAPLYKPVSRRTILWQAAALTAALAIVSLCDPLATPFMPQAWAEEHPPIGTYPEGSSGPSVTIGAAVPRTGTYAVQGEDELKGMQLAVEHINSGHAVIKKIAPKITKGVLGKEVTK